MAALSRESSFGRQAGRGRRCPKRRRQFTIASRTALDDRRRVALRHGREVADVTDMLRLRRQDQQPSDRKNTTSSSSSSTSSCSSSSSSSTTNSAHLSRVDGAGGGHGAVRGPHHLVRAAVHAVQEAAEGDGLRHGRPAHGLRLAVVLLQLSLRVRGSEALRGRVVLRAAPAALGRRAAEAAVGACAGGKAASAAAAGRQQRQHQEQHQEQVASRVPSRRRLSALSMSVRLCGGLRGSEGSDDQRLSCSSAKQQAH